MICSEIMTARLAAACLMLFFGPVAQALSGQIEVETYQGGFATVNSFIISNGKSMVVLDTQRKTYEAKKLAELIQSKRLPVTQILISHGHTDHFTGMAWLHEVFPDAQIVVSSEEIRRDIKAYAIYMDTGGQTGAEPSLEPMLRPKTAANPGGWDYEGLIQVLPAKRIVLDGGGTLEITDDYAAAEAPHASTVYCPEINALFLADFGYNRVHLWLGDDITRGRIRVWKSELQRIKAKYHARNPTVYPGHGAPGSLSMIDEEIRYIDDFLRVTAKARNQEEAKREMEALYPGYREADFFLKYSVMNHVR
jgi:glyoxylase-like metal-dependent hydrolase (beta-lactamase superfamily II)